MNDCLVSSEWEHYQDLVKIALMKLPREQEEVLSLRYFSSHTYKEIIVQRTDDLKKAMESNPRRQNVR